MATEKLRIELQALTAKAEKDIRSLDKSVKRTAGSIRALGSSSKTSLRPLGEGLSSASVNANEFEKSMAAANARVIAFGASAGIIYQVQRALRETVKATIEVEKSFADINVVLNTSQQNLQKFGNSLFKIAGQTGQGFKDVSEAATELARQGLSMEKTLMRTKDALILTRLTGMGAVESVASLTAAVNSFSKSGVTSAQVINKMAKVDQAFAVSSEDLAKAISRVGSSAVDAGVSLDELLAITTAVQQRTARGGAVIGNAFKTIFTRIGRTDVQQKLNAIGVATRDMQGNMLGATQVLKNLSDKFKDLSKNQQNQIAESVAGVFQVNILRASLGDLSNKYGIYNKALSDSATASDEAYRKNEQLNKTLDSLANKTLANLTKAGAAIGDLALKPAITELLNNVNSVIGSFEEGGRFEKFGQGIGKDLLKGLGNFLSGPGLLIGGFAVGKLLFNFGKFAKQAVSGVFELNSAVANRKNLESLVSQELMRQPDIINRIENGETSVAKEARKLLAVYKSQNYQADRLKKSTKAIAASMMFVSGGSRGGSRSKKGGKALGFVPNFADENQEKTEAALGGYQAGVIKKMTIPGEGPVMYNSAETVKRFPGMTQPAIMPPKRSSAGKNYRSSFLDSHGFDPYKAQGFIPNFKKVDAILGKNSFKGSLGDEKLRLNKDEKKKISKVADIKNVSEYASKRNRHVAKKLGQKPPKIKSKIYDTISGEGINFVTKEVSGPSNDKMRRDQTELALKGSWHKIQKNLPVTTKGLSQINFDQWNENRTKYINKEIGEATQVEPISQKAKNPTVDFKKQLNSLVNNLVGEVFERRVEKNFRKQTGFNRKEISNDRLDFDAGNLGSKSFLGGEAKAGAFNLGGLISKAIGSSHPLNKPDGKVNKLPINASIALFVPPDGKASGFIPNFSTRGTLSSQANPLKLKAAEEENPFINPLDTGKIGYDRHEVFKLNVRNKKGSTKKGGGKINNEYGTLAEKKALPFVKKLGYFPAKDVPGMHNKGSSAVDYVKTSNGLPTGGTLTGVLELKAGDIKTKSMFKPLRSLTENLHLPIVQNMFKKEGPEDLKYESILATKPTARDPYKMTGMMRKGRLGPKGFVPSFSSAISESIEREKSAGVPSSSIRIGSDSQLSSVDNPLGLGVYNTKDEPRGLNQGISRAKSMGLNPATHGAAEGFVPNFSKGNKRKRKKASQHLLDHPDKSDNQEKDNADKNEDSSNKMSEASVKMLAASSGLMILGPVLQDGIKSALGKEKTKSLEGFLGGEGAISSITDKLFQASMLASMFGNPFKGGYTAPSSGFTQGAKGKSGLSKFASGVTGSIKNIVGLDPKTGFKDSYSDIKKIGFKKAALTGSKKLISKGVPLLGYGMLVKDIINGYKTGYDQEDSEPSSENAELEEFIKKDPRAKLQSLSQGVTDFAQNAPNLTVEQRTTKYQDLRKSYESVIDSLPQDQREQISDNMGAFIDSFGGGSSAMLNSADSFVENIGNVASSYTKEEKSINTRQKIKEAAKRFGKDGDLAAKLNINNPLYGKEREEFTKYITSEKGEKAIGRTRGRARGSRIEKLRESFLEDNSGKFDEFLKTPSNTKSRSKGFLDNFTKPTEFAESSTLPYLHIPDANLFKEKNGKVVFTHLADNFKELDDFNQDALDSFGFRVDEIDKLNEQVRDRLTQGKYIKRIKTAPPMPAKNKSLSLSSFGAEKARLSISKIQTQRDFNKDQADAVNIFNKEQLTARMSHLDNFANHGGYSDVELENERRIAIAEETYESSKTRRTKDGEDLKSNFGIYRSNALSKLASHSDDRISEMSETLLSKDLDGSFDFVGDELDNIKGHLGKLGFKRFNLENVLDTSSVTDLTKLSNSMGEELGRGGMTDLQKKELEVTKGLIDAKLTQKKGADKLNDEDVIDLNNKKALIEQSALQLRIDKKTIESKRIFQRKLEDFNKQVSLDYTLDKIKKTSRDVDSGRMTSTQRMNLLESGMNQNRDIHGIQDLQKESIKSAQLGVQQSFSYGSRDYVDDIQSSFREIGDTFKSGISEAIKGMATGATDFKSAMANIFGSIADKTADRGIDMGVNALMNAGMSMFSKSSGGPIKKYQTGGLVTGGSGVKDDVLTMMQGGEYVIRKSAVNQIPGGVSTLDTINRSSGGGIPRFAAGGSANMSLKRDFKYTGKDKKRPTGGHFDVDSRMSTLGFFGAQGTKTDMFDRQKKLESYKDYVAAEKKRRADIIARDIAERKGRLMKAYISAAMTIGGDQLSKAMSSNPPPTGTKTTTNIFGESSSVAPGTFTPSKQMSRFLDVTKERSMLGNSVIAEGGFYKNNFDFASGGKVPAYASGGRSSGRVPGMVMGGEYIMSPQTTQQYGSDFMSQLNRGHLPGFAEGGLVGSEKASSGDEESKAKESSPTTNNVNISINIDKTGKAEPSDSESSSQDQSSEDVTKSKEFSQAIKGVVLEEIVKQQRPGGLLRDNHSKA
jgi:TP901 family phage tail tape measure protein